MPKNALPYTQEPIITMSEVFLRFQKLLDWEGDSVVERRLRMRSLHYHKRVKAFSLVELSL